MGTSRRLLFMALWFGFFKAKSQNTSYEQLKFCKSLHSVFESGRMENFESIATMQVKQSPFLQVPGSPVKLENFPVVYVDKDNRFVGKTNLSFDSVSALQKLDELKILLAPCLDTLQWKMWEDRIGDDSTTVFFKEEKIAHASSPYLNLDLAIVRVGEKARTLNLYIKGARP